MVSTYELKQNCLKHSYILRYDIAQSFQSSKEYCLNNSSRFVLCQMIIQMICNNLFCFAGSWFKLYE